MIVGVIGHIDHGKTSLVKALTGVDCDRLPAEKKRGITIELGFAYADHFGQKIGYIDVPGHEKLVHTMLAGMAGIDLIILVVAADDGPMPQTREHLHVAKLLGHGQVVVALTKCDRVVEGRLQSVEQDVAAVLRIADVTVTDLCRVSSTTGLGVKQLARILGQKAASLCRTNRGVGLFRMGVDRSFVLDGIGTVATGTIIAGEIQVGDVVNVAPNGPTGRVRSLHANGTPTQVAHGGTRCAVALSGRDISVETVLRGRTLVKDASSGETRRFDVAVNFLPGCSPTTGSSPIRFHHLSCEELGCLIPLTDSPLSQGGEDLAQIETRAGVSAFVGDRFILRDISATHTMGGGRILDIHAPKRRRRSPERVAHLCRLKSNGNAMALEVVLKTPPGVVNLGRWYRARALPQPAAEDLGLLELADGSAMYPGTWDNIAELIVARMRIYHAENPTIPGPRPAELCNDLKLSAFRDFLDGALERLLSDGTLAKSRSWLHLPNFQVQTPASDLGLLKKILPHLSGERRFDPARVRELARQIGTPEKTIRAVLQRASMRDEIAELEKDRFFVTDNLAACEQILANTLKKVPDGIVTLAKFRDELGVGRRVALIILEHFVRQGLITGDKYEYKSFNPVEVKTSSLGSLNGGATPPVG